MRSIHRAIIVAGLFGSLAAFQPSLQRRLRKSKGDSLNFVRPEICRRRQSSLSPLFAAFEPANAATKLYNRQYLNRTLGVSKDRIDKLSAKTGGGNILTLEIGVLEERVDWLTKRLHLKAHDMKRIAKQHTQALQQLPEKTLAPKLDYLQTRLLLDEASLRKLILAYPRVLDYSITDNIKPKLDWLQQRLDLDDAAVGKMIQRLPPILSYSVEDNLAPKLKWLQHRFDLDDAAVSRMIQLLPALLSYSVEDNIEPKLEWLQQHLRLDEAALSNMMQQFPALFGYNIDSNLEPTLNFYIDALGDEREAVALVLSCPAMLGYSLEKRLRPRLKDAQEAGMFIDSSGLVRIARYTNDKWDTFLGK